MTERAKQRHGLLMQLATELLTENEDLERRLNTALAILDELDCGDCMGTKRDAITKLPCVWCARRDALRIGNEGGI